MTAVVLGGASKLASTGGLPLWGWPLKLPCGASGRLHKLVCVHVCGLQRTGLSAEPSCRQPVGGVCASRCPAGNLLVVCASRCPAGNLLVVCASRCPAGNLLVVCASREWAESAPAGRHLSPACFGLDMHCRCPAVLLLSAAVTAHTCVACIFLAFCSQLWASQGFSSRGGPGLCCGE
jgi:hypothetical protein